MRFSSPGGRTRVEEAIRQLVAAAGRGLEHRLVGRTIYISTPERLDHPPQVFLPPRGTNTEGNDAAVQCLRGLTAVDLKDVALDDVFRFLADVTGLDVRPDWDNLGRGGIREDAVVNLRLRDVPADELLRLVLRGVVGGGAVRAVVWDGVLVVSTDAALQDDATRRRD